MACFGYVIIGWLVGCVCGYLIGYDDKENEKD